MWCVAAGGSEYEQRRRKTRNGSQRRIGYTALCSSYFRLTRRTGTGGALGAAT